MLKGSADIRFSPFKLALLCLLLQFYTQAHGEALIDIRPYVSGGISYDDNLFRFSNRDQAVASFGSDATSDVVRRASAGVVANIRLSLQLISLEASINQNRFNHFSLLDSDTTSGRGTWFWRIGSSLNGELSVRRDEAIGGFTEVRNPILNIQTTTAERATINWELKPDWRLHASLENLGFGNSVATYGVNDRQDVVTEAGIEYLNSSKNLLGVALRNVQSRYPRRDLFAATNFGSNNQQREILFDAGWWPSLKMHLNGEVGRAYHEFDEVPQRNFNTWNGRFSAEWYPTTQTLLSLLLRRETGIVDDLVSTYVQSDSITFAPSWAISSQINVRGVLSVEQRKYIGNTGFFFGAGAQREDKATIAGVFITYLPRDKVQLQATYQRENRSSNIQGLSFDDNTVGANLRIDFAN